MIGPSPPDPAAAAAPAVDDAAPMRLRGELPRVTRLSRKVLAGLGAIGCIGIGGALIYALQTPKAGHRDEELYSTDNRPTADGLAGLPRGYGDAPRLGPPLPGDLGRPILSAQERAGVGPGGAGPAESAARSAAAQAAERRRQEIETARTSRLFSAESRTGGSPSPPTPPDMLAGLPAPLGVPAAAPTTQERQAAFLAGKGQTDTLAAGRIVGPAAAEILQAGAVIPAALISGIRSDLPGQITAQVTENVYDSPTGRILVVPQGTRVIGEYDSNVQFGQSRVLLVWTRLIFPNGRSIVLDRQPGADASGYAGLQDGVDYHWGGLAKAAGLSTLLSIGAELAIDDQDRLLRALRNGGQDTINDAGQQIVRRQLNIAPTLTIRPGFPVRIIVTRDLVLESYGG